MSRVQTGHWLGGLPHKFKAGAAAANSIAEIISGVVHVSLIRSDVVMSDRLAFTGIHTRTFPRICHVSGTRYRGTVL